MDFNGHALGNVFNLPTGDWIAYCECGLATASHESEDDAKNEWAQHAAEFATED